MPTRIHPTNSLSHRRQFWSDAGMGFASLALSAMMQRDASSAAAHSESQLPHRARVKHVIWLFMIGGTSHLESFDPKPAINRYAGKTINETPYGSILDSPFNKENLRAFSAADNQRQRTQIYPLQVGFKRYGQSGIEISDWFPHIGSCVDDLAVVRSMWTTDNNHGAQLQFHTGRHALDGFFPTIGSWIHYGLGSLNDNLPSFIVMGQPVADCCGGKESHGAAYLGPQHAGVQLDVNPADPLPFSQSDSGATRPERAAELELLRALHARTLQQYPYDETVRARIKAYELAFRMQMAVPDVVELAQESAGIKTMYGLDRPETAPFGRQCLAARRMVERGVRFIQIYHGANGGAGEWDAHGDLATGHARLSLQIDQPIGALLKDLKQRGLLDETLVVWGTEFGRTPGSEGSNGRDHHPYGFSIWLAGGGIRGGVVHGATDELGWHAVEDRHYVTDLHATVLHLLGLDPHAMQVPGRKRLELEFGRVMSPILV